LALTGLAVMMNWNECHHHQSSDDRFVVVVIIIIITVVVVVAAAAAVVVGGVIVASAVTTGGLVELGYVHVNRRWGSGEVHCCSAPAASVVVAARLP
jgi:hypothetical protein